MRAKVFGKTLQTVAWDHYRSLGLGRARLMIEATRNR